MDTSVNFTFKYQARTYSFKKFRNYSGFKFRTLKIKFTFNFYKTDCNACSRVFKHNAKTAL